MPLDILQMLIVLVILFLLVRPVGTYMAAVFTRNLPLWIGCSIRSTMASIA